MREYLNNVMTAPWKIKAVFLLCFVGFGISAYLWSFKLSDAVVPCTISGCADVSTGEYSMMLGVPVAAWGAFFYSQVCLLSFMNMADKRKLSALLLGAFLLIGLIYTVYLRYLEFAVIGNWCIWCWGSALVVVIMSILYGIEFGRRHVKSEKGLR